jgi:FkbH-like protein
LVLFFKKEPLVVFVYVQRAPPLFISKPPHYFEQDVSNPENFPLPQDLEPVRLVVWDLDETFWHGTLTEGGIRDYSQRNHDIVIELARRGIISSICSRNDEADVRCILEERGIADYFVFASISWAPKAARLGMLIEAAQLRPETVLFIDDNPANLAEAAAAIPGLQTADAVFIPRLLDDPRFRGRDDSALTRLAQYRVLAARQHDLAGHDGDNVEFLRKSDIRVAVEYDVAAHLDRAIELINRTNQLNFTKQRLPEDIGEARRALTEAMAPFNRRAGLIRVTDAYGDYGFVGFYLLQQNRVTTGVPHLRHLLYFCFSCRVLGMGVEQWFFDWLHRPFMRAAGRKVVVPDAPHKVDWIRMVSAADGAPIAAEAGMLPEIRAHGACESQAVAHYLQPHVREVKTTGMFAAGALMVRLNGAPLLLSASSHGGEAFAAEMATLGIPYDLMATDYFQDAAEGTVFVFSGTLDAARMRRRYRHKLHGWEISVQPEGLPLLDLVNTPESEVDERIEAMQYRPAQREQVIAAVRHIRAEYDAVESINAEILPGAMEALFARVPAGSKMIVLLDDDRHRGANGAMERRPWLATYAAAIRQIAAPFPFVATLNFGDFILNDDEVQVAANHYDRMVYYRVAERILEVARGMKAKEIRERILF